VSDPGVAERIAVAAPFAAAVALYAISPEITKVIRGHVEATVAAAGRFTNTNSDGGPPHLSKEYIGDYLEYAIDAGQVLPTFALPLTGVVLALAAGLNPLAIGLLILVAIPGLVWIALRVFAAEPVTYVAKKNAWGRYTLLPTAGMIVNALAAAVVLVMY